MGNSTDAHDPSARFAGTSPSYDDGEAGSAAFSWIEAWIILTPWSVPRGDEVV